MPISFFQSTSASAADCVTTTYSVGDKRYLRVLDTSGCTWTVPSGVTELVVVLVGGGGGGGGGVATGGNLGGGGGGAGGLVKAETITVTANSTLTINVGTGGAGGAASTNGSSGANSTIVSGGTTLLSASGGGGGGGGNPSGSCNELSGDGGSNSSFTISQTTCRDTINWPSDFYENRSNWDGGGGGSGAGGFGRNGVDIPGNGGTGGDGGVGFSNTTLNRVVSQVNAQSGNTYGVLSNSNIYFAAGGAGGGTPRSTSNPISNPENASSGGGGGGGVGGLGGGGNGGFTTSAAGPTTPLANSGSGGGGGGGWQNTGYQALKVGSAGASGIALMEYTQPQVAQTTLTISSNISGKKAPYSQVLTLNTAGGSGTGAVTYAIAAGGTATGCSLANSTASNSIVATSAGTCLIQATKAADANYLSATSLTLTFSFFQRSSGSAIANDCDIQVVSTASVLESATSTDCYLAFTATGNNSWLPPSTISSATILIVAGGGAGGSGAWGGGGGAGGVVYFDNYSVNSSTPINLTVGAGGRAGTGAQLAPGNFSSSGEDSWINSSSTIVAKGGGAGASYSYGQTGNDAAGNPIQNGRSGGSGGGGTEFGNGSSGGTSSQSAINGAVVHGFAGAGYNASIPCCAGGGGGGAGGVGSQNLTVQNAGAGGIGINTYSNILNKFSPALGVSGYVAGGGGGGGNYGSDATHVQALGGAGGGGNGGWKSSRNGSAGAANTGGGGGGASYSNWIQGSNGGSGLIVIKYAKVTVPAAPTINSVTAGDRQLVINYTAGSDGGSAITGMSYSLNNGEFTSLSGSPHTVSNLVGNQSYAVRIRAQNAIGFSESSTAITVTTLNTAAALVYAAGELGMGTVPTVVGSYFAGDTLTVASGSTLSRSGFRFNGWKNTSNSSISVGSTLTLSGNDTLTAQWRQASLFGLTDNEITELQSWNASSNTNSGTVTNSISSFTVTVPGSSLPTGTTVKLWEMANSNLARSKVGTERDYIVNLVLSWLKSDGTVPTASTPVTLSIQNSSIRSGAKAYQIIGDVVTQIGTATADGVLNLSVIDDPVIVVSNLTVAESAQIAAAASETARLAAAASETARLAAAASETALLAAAASETARLAAAASETARLAAAASETARLAAVDAERTRLRAEEVQKIAADEARIKAVFEVMKKAEAEAKKKLDEAKLKLQEVGKKPVGAAKKKAEAEAKKRVAEAKVKWELAKKQVETEAKRQLAEPTIDKVAEPTIDKVAEPLTDKVAEPLTDKVAEPLTDKIAETTGNKIQDAKQKIAEAKKKIEEAKKKTEEAKKKR
jgi:hypothetical protein